MLVGKYWVGCGGQKNPSLACKQLHVLKNVRNFFCFGVEWGICFGNQRTSSPPFKCLSLFFQASSWKERGKEGRSVGRKGGKKWKHLSRRAEAIRNACWVSKTENREKGIKIKSSVKKRRWGWKGLCYFVKRRTRPKHNTVPGSIQTRQSKYNHLMKKRQGGWTDGGKSAPGSSVWSCIYETMKMKRRLYALFLQLSRQPYLMAGHRFKKIITALSNVKSHLWAQKTHKEKQRERDREAHSFSSPLIMSTVILSFPSFYAGLPK